MNDISLIEVFINNERAGRLALTPERLCAFEMGIIQQLLTGKEIRH